MRAYEIHTFREGVWKVDSVFDDREIAMFEAKRVDDSSRYSGVKLVEEVYDEANDRTTIRTLFRGGAAKSAKRVAEPGSKSKRAGSRGGAGKSPTRRGRRKQKTHSSILVPFLILIILLLTGLVGLLGLNYLSALK